MKKIIQLILGSVLFMVVLSLYSCKEDEYSMGDISTPSDIQINVKIAGADAENPNGDGSGVVTITPTAKYATSYRIGFTEVDKPNSVPNFVFVNGESFTQKFTTAGNVKYRITVIAYGSGGASSTGTKDITVKSVFDVEDFIVNFLTNNSAKTWRVEKETAGHFGVGPWTSDDDGWLSPVWWSAAPNDKEACCNCFYTSRFTFKKSGSDFSLDVHAPDGVYTKTGGLTTLPGIPASGDEACYPFNNGTGQASSAFAFASASSAIPAGTPSTKTSIILAGNDTFIGYGSFQKEYEILEITENLVYLRVQGTEVGNAWYLRLVPAP